MKMCSTKLIINTFRKVAYVQYMPSSLNYLKVRNERRFSTSNIKLTKSLSRDKEKDEKCIKDGDEEKDLSVKLISWAMENNISYLTFSKLLRLLQEHGLEHLPKNSKDLLRAKENEINEFVVQPGLYTHFGLKNNLTQVILHLRKLKLFDQPDISVSVFIDCLPMFSLNKKVFWTILGSVNGFNNIIFLIGAYNGSIKPKNANLFLSKFIEEANDLCLNGLEIDSIKHTVTIKRLICDAPAKAFIMDVKGYTGYSSCTKCHVVGVYKNMRMCFPQKSKPKVDDDYKKDDVYQNEKTKLLEIPKFGLVSSIPLDYLHLVCLGVVKKLLSFWFVKERDYWISKERASVLFKPLSDLSPCEFKIKPKVLEKLPSCSSFEARQFLLYHGPVALKNSLHQKYYNHFLSLHVACRLFCMENSKNFIQSGDKLLNKFVEDFKEIYGEEHITHNVHGLYHLAEDCSNHGTLDNFSAFPFERFLLQLRDSIKKMRRKPLPKMILRYSSEKILAKNLKALKTKDISVSKKIDISSSSFMGDSKKFSQYGILNVGKTQVIPGRNGDKYVFLKNGKVIEVVSILGGKDEIYIAGREFSSISNFYTEPMDSSLLDIFKVQDLLDTIEYWPASLIHKKCMKIPMGPGEYVMIGLLREDY